MFKNLLIAQIENKLCKGTKIFQAAQNERLHVSRMRHSYIHKNISLIYGAYSNFACMSRIIVKTVIGIEVINRVINLSSSCKTSNQIIDNELCFNNNEMYIQYIRR